MQTQARLIVVAVATMALLVAGSLVAAAGTDAENGFVDLINADRRAAGAGALVVEDDLVAVARSHVKSMAEAGEIFHNSRLGYEIDNHYMVGENVGRGGDVVSLHGAFMASDGHRANILNPVYDSVGVGVTYREEIQYVVVVFRHSKTPPVKTPPATGFTPPFADDDGSVHEADITELHRRGITRGCAADRYCPDRPVTRGELATMLVRAFDLTGPTGTSFADTHSSEHRSAISILAHNGITKGCSTDRFCPERAVTRGELATFFTRLLGLPAASPSGFLDVASSEHRVAIGSLAAAGITRGCSDDRFCPTNPVTRGQLASFLLRALDLR